jgi:PAS domain S-box-containing protein
MDVLEKTFEFAADAILIVNGSGKVLRANIACEHLFGYSKSELAGMTVESLMPERFRAAHVHHRAGYGAHPAPRPMGSGLDLVALRKDGTETPVDITLNMTETDRGKLIIVALRDVTERKKLLAAQETLLRKLQDTLREIKVLRGLIPICAYCKKIREDSGQWTQLEEYIKEHSDADFSHGICPTCIQEHFPEYPR